MPNYEEAVSFPGTIPPEDAKEIDRKEHTVLGTVIYYKGKSGTVYYASEHGLRFAAKMEEAILRQKRK
ncbi:MAG: hypothetical protein IJ420_00530 [Lachnospiraceae bacterium]|nr:hypothetical protein [Lachnospiraceae bacterium]MBQ8632074.1 hypothetical protein [Lachnospiraceae bacterium]